MTTNRVSGFYSVEVDRTCDEGDWFIYCRIHLGGWLWYRVVEAAHAYKVLDWIDELYLPEFVTEDAVHQVLTHAKAIEKIQSKNAKRKKPFKYFMDWALGYRMEKNHEDN